MHGFQLRWRVQETNSWETPHCLGPWSPGRVASWGASMAFPRPHFVNSLFVKSSSTICLASSVFRWDPNHSEPPGGTAKTRTTQGKDQPQTCHRPVHRPPTLLPERGGFTSRHVTAPAFKGKSGRNVSGCSEVCGLGWRHTAGDGAAARERSGGHRTKARGPACHAVPLCTLPILSHMQVLLNKHTFKKKNTPVSCTPQIK